MKRPNLAHLARGGVMSLGSGTGPVIMLGMILFWVAGCGLAIQHATPGSRSSETFLYVSNEGSNDLTIIDSRRYRSIKTLPVGEMPGGVALTRDGKRLYVANYTNTVTVVDTVSKEVVETIKVGEGATGLVLTPNERFLYVTNRSSHTVSLIDRALGQTVRTIPVGLGPNWIDVSPDGRFVYVSNGSSSEVVVIETASNEVIEKIKVGEMPTGLKVSPDGRTIWVADYPRGITIIDASTTEILSVLTLVT